MAILLFNENKGQNKRDNLPFSSIDNLLSTMYGIIAGAEGTSRNWALFRKLFRSEARINALGRDKHGQERYISLTVEDYIRGAEATFQKQPLKEVEIGRKTEEYGEMVHIFSAYETKNSLTDSVLQRGINSIQLIYRDERYWIVSLLFNPETDNNPIPEQHLFPKEEIKTSKTRKSIYQK
ncbi:MAG: hypothetical protein EBS35_02560 [Bacteroidetes bacterium]|nr:hypothetical protein [Bacteroidota bacterium]